MGWSREGRWWELKRVQAKANLLKIQDSIEDGDVFELSKKAKLTVANVREMRQSFWAEGFELYQLASIYQVSEVEAMKVVMYETYGAAVLDGEVELPQKKVMLRYEDKVLPEVTDISSRPDPEKL